MIFRASFFALALGGTALAQDDIQVRSLDALDPLEVGLPDAGLSSTLWDGSGARMIHRILTDLPSSSDADGYASLYVGEVVRAVLSTGGYPPQGGRGSPELAYLRADRLLAASGAYDAYDLLDRTPAINRNTQLSELYAELAFALGDSERACRAADSLLDGREQAYWLRARAYCMALGEQTAAAELTAELARSSESDEGYDQLLFALTLGTGLSGDMPALTSGLKLAMARQIVGAGGVAMSPGDDAPGWLKRHLDAMAGVDFAPADDPAQYIAEAENESGAMRRALLEAALQQGHDRETAARALVLLLADARSEDRFLTAAHRYGREVQTLPVTRTTLDHGVDFALAALAVDDVRTARRWRDALISGPRPVLVTSTPDIGEPAKPETEESEWVPPSPRQIVLLDLTMAVSRDRLRAGDMSALISAYLEGHGSDGVSDVAALTALGAMPVTDMRVYLLDAASGLADGRIAAMEAAARGGAQAETALLAAGVLANGEAMPVDALARVVRALDRVGLREAALALIVERLIARSG